MPQEQEKPRKDTGDPTGEITPEERAAIESELEKEAEGPGGEEEVDPKELIDEIDRDVKEAGGDEEALVSAEAAKIKVKFWGKARERIGQVGSIATSPEVLKSIGKAAYETTTSVLGAKTVTDLALAIGGKGDIANFFKERFGRHGTKEEKTEMQNAFEELLAAAQARREEKENLGAEAIAQEEKTGEQSAAKQELSLKIKAYKEKIASAAHVPEAEKKALREQLSSIVAKNINKEETAEKERKKETGGVIGTYLETKIKGTKLAKDALNTALTVSGMVALRGLSYGLMAGLERAQKANIQFEKEKLGAEFRKSKQERMIEKRTAENLGELKHHKIEEFGEQSRLQNISKDVFVNSARETGQALAFRGEKSGARKTADFVQAAGVVLRGLGIGGTAASEIVHAGLTTSVTESADKFLAAYEQSGVIGAAGKNFVSNAERMAYFYTHPIDSLTHRYGDKKLPGSEPAPDSLGPTDEEKNIPPAAGDNPAETPEPSGPPSAEDLQGVKGHIEPTETPPVPAKLEALKSWEDTILTPEGSKSHDSIWASTRSLLKAHAAELGVNKTGADLDKWAETQTANLVKQLGLDEGGKVKDLVHNYDKVVLSVGADNKPYLRFEAASGHEAGYLPEHKPIVGYEASPVRPEAAGVEAKGLGPQTEVFGPEEAPLKAGAEITTGSGQQALSPETGGHTGEFTAALVERNITPNEDYARAFEHHLRPGEKEALLSDQPELERRFASFKKGISEFSEEVKAGKLKSMIIRQPTAVETSDHARVLYLYQGDKDYRNHRFGLLEMDENGEYHLFKAKLGGLLDRQKTSFTANEATRLLGYGKGSHPAMQAGESVIVEIKEPVVAPEPEAAPLKTEALEQPVPAPEAGAEKFTELVANQAQANPAEARAFAYLISPEDRAMLEKDPDRLKLWFANFGNQLADITNRARGDGLKNLAAFQESPVRSSTGGIYFLRTPEGSSYGQFSVLHQNQDGQFEPVVKHGFFGRTKSVFDAHEIQKMLGYTGKGAGAEVVPPPEGDKGPAAIVQEVQKAESGPDFKQPAETHQVINEPGRIAEIEETKQQFTDEQGRKTTITTQETKATLTGSQAVEATRKGHELYIGLFAGKIKNEAAFLQEMERIKGSPLTEMEQNKSGLFFRSVEHNRHSPLLDSRTKMFMQEFVASQPAAETVAPAEHLPPPKAEVPPLPEAKPALIVPEVPPVAPAVLEAAPGLKAMEIGKPMQIDAPHVKGALFIESYDGKNIKLSASGSHYEVTGVSQGDLAKETLAADWQKKMPGALGNERLMFAARQLYAEEEAISQLKAQGYDTSQLEALHHRNLELNNKSWKGIFKEEEILPAVSNTEHAAHEVALSRLRDEIGDSTDYKNVESFLNERSSKFTGQKLSEEQLKALLPDGLHEYLRFRIQEVAETYLREPNEENRQMLLERVDKDRAIEKFGSDAWKDIHKSFGGKYKEVLESLRKLGEA